MPRTFTVDEYGVRNYKFRYIFGFGYIITKAIIAILAIPTYFFEVGAPGATVENYYEAFWLMNMAASTIGFGDEYPVTMGGKWMVDSMFYIGVGMMAMLGGLIAAKVLGRFDTNVKNRELRKQNDAILSELQDLKSRLNV